MSDRHLAQHIGLVSNNSPYPFSLLCPSLLSLHLLHFLCPRLLSFLGCVNSAGGGSENFQATISEISVVLASD